MGQYQSLCGQVDHRLRTFQLLVEGEGDEELRQEYEAILAEERGIYRAWSAVPDVGQAIGHLTRQLERLVGHMRNFQRRSKESRRRRNHIRYTGNDLRYRATVE